MSDIFSGAESAATESATGSEKPLTDEERKLLQRLLSDPFSIPQQFKTWLVAYLEGSDMLLARSSIQGLNDLLGSGGGGQGILGLLPAGLIFPYGGTAEPTGAKLCNGQPLVVANYKRLFDVIGYAYGGSGANFNVPDLRRRLPLGTGTGRPVGGNEGRAEASRDIDHHHYFGQTSDGGGAHDHAVGMSGAGDHNHARSIVGGGGNYDALTNMGTMREGQTTNFYTAVSGGANFPQNAGAHTHSAWTSVDGDHQHFVEGDTSGGFDNNRPAFLVVNYIISY